MYAEWCLCQDFDPSHDRCDLKQNLLDADCDTTSIVFPDHAENKTLVRHTLLSTAARSPRGMLQHTVCQCNFSNEYCAGAFTLLYRYSMGVFRSTAVSQGSVILDADCRTCRRRTLSTAVIPSSCRHRR